MNTATTILLYVGVAALVFYKVIYTQLRGTLLTRSGLAKLPLLLVAIGGFFTIKALPGASAAEIGLLAADVAVLAVLGAIRSTSTTLTERAGTTFQKGSAMTVLLWVVTIAVRFGFVGLGTVLGITGPLTSASIALTIGVSIGVQNALTYYRIQQLRLPLAEQRAVAAAR
ncbi:hypothetical protein ACFWY9_03115 [Amycolatopsis sp. NPDC059027]|uniref:hypothetical protein n=1 Tax=unclassified Amycolatopsis TaxID=2618356 RepID=UPI00366D0C6D